MPLLVVVSVAKTVKNLPTFGSFRKVRYCFIIPKSGTGHQCTDYLPLTTSSGAMAYREYYGGYWLNADGSWTYPYTASWKLTDGRWWYGDNTGWYAKNQTLWIDGTAYGFDAEGYLQ